MMKLEKMRDLSFGAFGIALGYASNLGIPQQNLLALGSGLILCAIAYFCIRDYEAGVQALLLSVGAAAILTSKLFSAIFTIIFLVLGFFLLVAALFLHPREKTALQLVIASSSDFKLLLSPLLSALNRYDLIDSNILEADIVNRQRISGEFHDPLLPIFETPELSYEAIQTLTALKMDGALERPFTPHDVFAQVALMMPPVFYMSLIGAAILDILLFRRWKK